MMYKKGFTIIESMVAVTILTFAITGATSIVHGSLVNASLIKAKGQAVGLAVEGIEYARNLHDQDASSGLAYVPGTPFYNFVTNCSGGCKFNANAMDVNGVVSSTYEACSSDCFLDKTDTGYVTAVGNMLPESYDRNITVQTRAIDTGFEFEINSKVDYFVKGQSRSVTIDSYHFFKDGSAVVE
jgi:prepilin-type N-terminal cleavage/methylation domain-containing protein